MNFFANKGHLGEIRSPSYFLEALALIINLDIEKEDDKVFPDGNCIMQNGDGKKTRMVCRVNPKLKWIAFLPTPTSQGVLKRIDPEDLFSKFI